MDTCNSSYRATQVGDFELIFPCFDIEDTATIHVRSFIPEDGSQFTVDACGLHIEVQSFNERRVEWALVSRLPEEETPEEQEK